MKTRDKIIEISAELFHKYGYNKVGISSILKEAKVPKGSFYHYFKSKEDLLIEVIKYFNDESFQIFNSFSPTIEGLQDFFESYFDRFESLGFTRGCPFGNFALELADINEDVRKYLNIWTDKLSNMIEEILIIDREMEADEATKLSSFIVSAFEGSLLKAKIEKNRESLDEFKYFIFDKLLI